jgi:hypothetical protein
VGQSKTNALASIDFPIDERWLIRRVVAFCVGCELLFVLMDYHINYGRLTDVGTLRRLANIAREDGLASWFGTTQTTFLALTVWLSWFIVRRGDYSVWRKRGWLLLAIFFSVMAVDDGALLHERAGTLFSQIHSEDAPGGAITDVGSSLLDAFPSYAWQIVALPIFVVLGIFTSAFLWRELPARRMRITVAIAMFCFVIAVSLDFVEGLDEEHPWNLATLLVDSVDFGDWTQYRFRAEPFDTVRHFSKSAEEFLEMLANTLLWSVFLARWAQLWRDVRVRVTEREAG